MEEELSEFKKEISSITESIIISEDKVMTAIMHL